MLVFDFVSYRQPSSLPPFSLFFTPKIRVVNQFNGRTSGHKTTLSLHRHQSRRICTTFSDINIELARANLDFDIFDGSDDDDDDDSDDDDYPEEPRLTHPREFKPVLEPDPNELIGLKNHDGDTALHLAVQAGHLQTAALLISKKPELAFRLTGGGISPLYLAVKSKFRPLVKYIFRRIPGKEVSVDIRKKLVGNPNASLAHAAVKARDYEILHTIFSNFPDLVDSKDKRGWKPISYAAYKGYYEEVCYFLQHFPNCAKECEDDGSFPIHKAISGGNLSIVKLFMTSYPKSMFQRDRNHRTVLHIAARYQRMNVLYYFMKIIKSINGDANTYKDFVELRDVDGNTYKEFITRSRL